VLFRKRRGQKPRDPSGRHLLGNWASPITNRAIWAIFRHKRSIHDADAPLLSAVQLANDPHYALPPHINPSLDTHKPTTGSVPASRFSYILGHAAGELAPPTQLVICGDMDKFEELHFQSPPDLLDELPW
jgi:hypothetical protein